MRTQLLVATAVVAAAAPAPGSGGDVATVVMSASVLFPAPISPRMVGLSTEVSAVPHVLAVGGLGGRPRASLPRLLNALRAAGGADAGPHLRVGGDSTDFSAYLPPPAPLPAGDHYRISDTDLRLYGAAVAAWNGTLSLGLNFRDPANASLAVAHLAAAVDPSRGGLASVGESYEVGNEVELYRGNSVRNRSYDYPDYRREFGTYAAALAPLFPTGEGRIRGAVWSTTHWIAEGTGNWSDYISRYGPGGTNSLNSLSYHHYAQSVCHGLTASLAGLMDDNATTGIAQLVAPLAAVATAAGLPFHIGEGNSCACGGAPGVSDVFASALWGVDALFSLAAVGVSRFNFHGMPTAPYSVIIYNGTGASADVPIVRPLFYGLWAFATAARGGAVIHTAAVNTTNAYVKAWAVRDGAGGWRLVLLHKDYRADAPASATVTVVPPSPLTGAATLTRLSGGPRGINATDADPITFGGLTYLGTVDGTPSGTPVAESVPANGAGAFVVTLPRGSGAILELPAA